MFTFGTKHSDEEGLGSGPGEQITDGEVWDVLDHGPIPLPIWEKDRIPKLKQIGRKNIINKSSFSIPKGWVNGPKWDHDFSDSERYVGMKVSGNFQNAEGKPLNGTGYILKGEKIGAKKTINGSFLMKGPIPSGIMAGESKENSQYDFRFVPGIAGGIFEEPDISAITKLGVVQYGSLKGTVKNGDGEPIEGEPITTRGVSTLSDEDGEYVIQFPGGEETQVLGLQNSCVKTADIQPGRVTELDWQYPSLEVRVIDLSGNPVENSPVTINEKSHTTDSDGKVRLTKPKLGEYALTVMDEFTKIVSISEEGEEYIYTFTDGSYWDEDDGGNEEGDNHDQVDLAGVKIRVVDSESGEPINDIRAIETKAGVRSVSNEDGVIKILTKNVDEETTVKIGYDSHRYSHTAVSGEWPDDRMEEITVELDQKSPTTRY